MRIAMKVRLSLIGLAFSPNVLAEFEKVVQRSLIKAYHSKAQGYEHTFTLDGALIREMEKGSS